MIYSNGGKDDPNTKYPCQNRLKCQRRKAEMEIPIEVKRASPAQVPSQSLDHDSSPLILAPLSEALI
ncbi:hypothetical protein TNCV_1117821 [Trichonephila clavipes]|nr:hypothetical protein TNCV_1117821 [Trichonephila clavipes]